MITVSVFIVWFFIGYVSVLVGQMIFVKKITVGDLFSALLMSIGGPVITVLLIFVIIAEWLERRKFFNKEVWKKK